MAKEVWEAGKSRDLCEDIWAHVQRYIVPKGRWQEANNTILCPHYPVNLIPHVGFVRGRGVCLIPHMGFVRGGMSVNVQLFLGLVKLQMPYLMLGLVNHCECPFILVSLVLVLLCWVTCCINVPVI